MFCKKSGIEHEPRNEHIQRVHALGGRQISSKRSPILLIEQVRTNIEVPGIGEALSAVVSVRKEHDGGRLPNPPSMPQVTV
ncbi:MAG: hypothetical protein R2855_08290 [Thermomicrobiales bacterium]